MSTKLFRNNIDDRVPVVYCGSHMLSAHRRCRDCGAAPVVMDKFGSELRFEPEPPRTEPEVQFRVLKNG